MISSSAALQTASENFLQSFRPCASDLMLSKSPFLLKGGIGKFLSIDFALLMSLLIVVMIPSLDLPLILLSDLSK